MESINYKSMFWEYLLLNNKEHLVNFKRWIFHPGMLFNSWEEWWGDKKSRSAAHQGIDLCFFEDTNGQINNVDINLKIPATFSGEIVKIEKDFLGKSIYLSHNIFSGGPRQLYTIYGHTDPFASINLGKKVAEGELIAGIAGVPQKTGILPHLHLTLAWIPVSVNPDDLNWQNLVNDRMMTLIDPLSVLSTP